MKVRDIGIKDVYYATLSMNLTEVAAMMKRHNVGVMPVCDDGKLVGMLTDRDMVTCFAAGMNAGSCKAKEFMTSNPVTATPEMNIDDAAKAMGKEQVRRLPVVENGKLVGMLSLGDVASVASDGVVAETLRKVSMPKQDVLVC